MATTANNVDLSEAVDRLAQLINNQGYKLLEIESDLRHLDMRIDGIVPTTLNTTVLPTTKVALGAVLVGVAVGGYVGYVEIQRYLNKKNRKVDEPTDQK